MCRPLFVEFILFLALFATECFGQEAGLCNCSLDQANALSKFESFGEELNKLSKEPSVFDIKVYQKKTKNDGVGAPDPFAAFRPNSFYYKQDVEAAKNKKVKPIKIAGINCDDVIREAPSLTGINLENLSLRARGTNPPVRSDHDKVRPKEPEWKGAEASFALRASMEGFISEFFPPKNAKDLDRQKKVLRNILLSDNANARKAGVSHQQIADPILKAIENHISGNQTEFLFNGEIFNLVAYSDSQKYFLSDIKNEKGNKDDSGWIGNNAKAPLQGSFFDDELATGGRYYHFTRKNPKEGKPNEFIIDGLTPHLIYRYGFYQAGPYRVDPVKIIEFFGVKPASTDVWDECKSTR